MLYQSSNGIATSTSSIGKLKILGFIDYSIPTLTQKVALDSLFGHIHVLDEVNDPLRVSSLVIIP
jgi:hypothetical protein